LAAGVSDDESSLSTAVKSEMSWLLSPPSPPRLLWGLHLVSVSQFPPDSVGVGRLRSRSSGCLIWPLHLRLRRWVILRHGTSPGGVEQRGGRSAVGCWTSSAIFLFLHFCFHYQHLMWIWDPCLRIFSNHFMKNSSVHPENIVHDSTQTIFATRRLCRQECHYHSSSIVTTHSLPYFGQHHRHVTIWNGDWERMPLSVNYDSRLVFFYVFPLQVRSSHIFFQVHVCGLEHIRRAVRWAGVGVVTVLEDYGVKGALISCTMPM
jgi:hypothetical protein